MWETGLVIGTLCRNALFAMKPARNRKFSLLTFHAPPIDGMCPGGFFVFAAALGAKLLCQIGAKSEGCVAIKALLRQLLFLVLQDCMGLCVIM